MEEILKNLSEYQQEALRKGISFDVDLYINDKHIPSIAVKMYYSSSGHITEAYAWNTTFTPTTNSRYVQEKLSKIDSFISNISEQTNKE